jgi:uncharacterized protein YbaA (DUF1428 family)
MMMTPTDATLPQAVSRNEWLDARKALLAKEKELTRHRDAVNAERRRLLYKSRAHRDRVNAKVMKDPRIKNMMDPKAMPFDGKRMFWGGFKVLVEL